MTDYTKLLSDFPEINPANYGDDEVNALNAWGIAAHTAIEALQAKLDAAPKALAPEQVEAAWRAGWAACRDAEFVGQEAEDEAWGMSETCANADWESAAPKALAPLAPLTQPEVVEAFCNTPHNVQYVSVFDAGVRFAEKHHGIGGTP